MKQALASVQPFRRAGSVDDISWAAVFLASDESSFINGHNLVVDVGLTGGLLYSENCTRYFHPLIDPNHPADPVDFN